MATASEPQPASPILEPNHARADAWLVAAAVGLVLLRSFVFVWYQQSAFDSDEAVTGLMAKHLLDGRAFPLFQYAQNYVLVVEAWLTVPAFWLFGVSAGALKGTVLALNLIVAGLLLLCLRRTVNLRPVHALAAAVFFLVPPPITGSALVKALGMNIEPFLWVLLIWITRRRPLLLGAVFAIGFLNREFTAYGISALLLIEAADRSLFSWASARDKMRAAASAVAVWQLVQLLKPFADPLGPGTSWRPMTAASGNVDTLVGFVAFDPARLMGDIAALLTVHLPGLLGARQLALEEGSLRSAVGQGHAWLLPLALLLVLIVMVRGLHGQRLRGWRGEDEGLQFCAYLMLVGAQAALAFAVARGARMHPMIYRYVLLALLVPVGLIAWHLRVETSRAIRGLVMAGCAVWAIAMCWDHGTLVEEYVTRPPEPARQVLARYLTSNRVRYGEADYWVAYYVDFLSREQIKLHAPLFRRIEEYSRLLRANPSEAVMITEPPCGPGGTRVAVWCVQPVVPSSQNRP